MDIDDHVPCGRPRFSRNLKGVRSINKIELPKEETSKIIDIALAEDISYGDITSEILIPPGLVAKAHILAKEEGVLAGGGLARLVFLKVEPGLVVELLVPDGQKVRPGDIVAVITGSIAGILKAERVALNFLSHLSGVASLTAQYVIQAQCLGVAITDTRKTLPGLRMLEKYAVLMGGGHNHRFHLGDSILVKDNHIAALAALGMSLADIVVRAKQNAPQGLKVEVEVSTVEEALDAVQAGVDVILLDNMSPDEMSRVVEFVPKLVKIEASGNIRLGNVHPVAETGVSTIPVGAITHSAKALDFSLELEPL